MKTLVLMMSLLSLLVLSISCNKSEEQKATDSMQREESRAQEPRVEDMPSDVKEDIQEEEMDVREEQMDVEGEKDDVQNTIDKAREDVEDETRMED